MKNFQTEVAKKLETRILCSTNFFFPRKSCRLWEQLEKYCRVGQATDDNMTLSHSILDTYGYKYTHRLCNTHGVSTTTIFAGTRLIVTAYVYCLSCLNIRYDEKCDNLKSKKSFPYKILFFREMCCRVKLEERDINVYV